MESFSDLPATWGVNVEQFDALLFDLDGTLVDTMSLHYRAYAEVFRARGGALQESDYMSLVGAPARDAIPLFCSAAGVAVPSASEVANIHREKKTAFASILLLKPPPVLPAATFLRQNHGKKKLALVTSGNRDGTMQILDSLGWEAVFDCVISGDDVAHGKPHPEPYLKAAAQVNVEPYRCLVFEDTQAGLESGLRAGMKVIDVTGPLPALLRHPNPQ